MIGGILKAVTFVDRPYLTAWFLSLGLLSLGLLSLGFLSLDRTAGDHLI